MATNITVQLGRGSFVQALEKSEMKVSDVMKTVLTSSSAVAEATRCFISVSS